MRRLELYELIKSECDAVQWCREKGLLLIAMNCPECQHPMTEVKHQCQDGSQWKCSRTVDGFRHYRSFSIRHHSIFSNIHHPIRKLVFLLYEWCENTGVDKAAYQMDMDRKAVMRLYQNFRHAVARRFSSQQTGTIGGSGETVEIDECQLGRRKHNHGRIPKELWCFGGIIRNSHPPVAFLQLVKKRNKRTLIPIIQQRINPLSTIISDDWGAYRCLSESGFSHKIVKHSENFIDPTDSTIHTQNIENMWRCVRRFLATKGTHYRKHLDEYLSEFIFRRGCIDVFETMTSTIERFFGE